MFSDNLIALRRFHKLTQEELAEKIGVSRQAVAKWESGDSQPDVERFRQLAKCFDVSMDDLAGESSGLPGAPLPPKGKYFFGAVKVGDKGQIVIPARARKVFDIKTGDSLICLGDEERGLALLPEKDMLHLLEMSRAYKETEK